MILNILDQSDDILFKNHIQNFKNKFFKFFTEKKKVLILNENCDITQYFKCYYRYLCRLHYISDVHIIIDGEKKEIIFAFNKEKLNSSYNIAFHGDEYNLVNKEFQIYDRILDNFDIDNICEEYIVVQKFIHNNPNLVFDLYTNQIFDYLRKFKSEYEIKCTIIANKNALVGHNNVFNKYINNKENFISEMDIYNTYISSLNINVDLYPYNPITAIGENSSILHYKIPKLDKVYAHSILIDAGTTFNGYSSDITKTYSKDNYWNEIIRDIQIIQKLIIDNIKIGHSFYDLYLYSRRLMIEHIIKHKYIINVDKCLNFSNLAFDINLDRLFYTHSLGHLLGLYVHDVGSNLEEVNGKIKFNNCNQFTRNFIFENCVLFTIEPGFYINSFFINNFCSDIQRKYINFDLIEEKKHYGGVRIETNILIYNDKVYDITTILEKENLSI